MSGMWNIRRRCAIARHKVFVYGTLRSGQAVTHEVVGYELRRINGRKFDFPAAYPGVGVIYGSMLEVNDKELEELDNYEGVHSGLYTREEVVARDKLSTKEVPCFMYVAGPQLALPTLIPSGDWLNN